MDTKFEWKEEYNIGVDIIDQEHQRLFRIINRLFAAREGDERESQWACQEGIKYFQGHAIKHFVEEESYMLSIGYKGFDRHRSIHKGFRENTLPALEQELVRTGYSPEAMDHFLGVCTGWLVGHTLLEDRAIVGENRSPGESMLPEGETATLKKVIAQLVCDMFQLQTRVISDVYGGEKFGEGVYYRLVYGRGSDEKKLEILLAFEEKLLINTIGVTIGKQPEHLDAMLINASRYTARQLVGRVLEYFPALRTYELKEENLLSYEQLQRVFQRQPPQASLLFSTGGAGYFAFCMIAPHILEAGGGTPISHDNAVSEVEKYLQQEQAASGKPKILIVDDSLTIREGMRRLLAETYDVTVAESSVAAIRAITLNHPDLVLLDYEMPVCDGRQTLEMLRAEKEFADLPVMFLTGRRDRESMIQVMPLKPAGYLLKDSKPAELKKEVDAFFAK
ncbi:MAG: response regulator [Oscillospiraceae bacterium]|nr:response regulator [Oscillospiraceae bacterium]